MWHMGDGWGWWVLFAATWSVVFLAAFVWALRAPADRSNGGTQSGSTAPLEILERRYAAGDLTDEQFERMRQRMQRPAGG